MPACTEGNMKPHFDRLEALFAQHAYVPQLIFNIGETVVAFSRGKVGILMRHDDTRYPTGSSCT